MSNWSQDDAITEFHRLASETRQLEGQEALCEQHTRWLLSALAILEEVFGQASRFYRSLGGLQWQEAGPVTVGGWSDPEGSLDPNSALRRKHHEAYVRDLGTARGLLLGAADHLARVGLEEVYQGKDTPAESSAILRVINLAEHKLRKVIRDPPTKERDVQDAYENLLVGADVTYSRENESIEYSSKTYTPDFVVPRLDLAIEIKLCGRDGREKEIIAEINDDVLAYETKFGNLLFVVYDVGLIRDADRFTGSFEEHDNVVVRVVKH